MLPTSIRAFLRALMSSWFTGMSGPLSVPLAIAAVFVSGDVAKALLGLTAFACFWGASYGVWAREHTARVAAEKKSSIQGLDLSFHDVSVMVLDPDRPRRTRVYLTVKNISGSPLGSCRIQLRLLTPNDYSHTYPIGSSFSLLVDEDKHVPILEYNIDEDDHHILIPIFGGDEDAWSDNGGLVFTEDTEHEFLFEAMSSGTKAERLFLRARYERDAWRFDTGTPAASRTAPGVTSPVSVPCPL
jgi:hypothetical protein